MKRKPLDTNHEKQARDFMSQQLPISFDYKTSHFDGHFNEMSSCTSWYLMIYNDYFCKLFIAGSGTFIHCKQTFLISKELRYVFSSTIISLMIGFFCRLFQIYPMQSYNNYYSILFGLLIPNPR